MMGSILRSRHYGCIVWTDSLILIGVWAVWVIKGNQQRPRKNEERFVILSIDADRWRPTSGRFEVVI